MSRSKNCQIILAHDSIQHTCLASYILSPVRPCVTRVDQSKTVEDKIMKFSPYVSSIPLVLRGKFHPKFLRGSPSGGIKQGRVGKTCHFITVNVNISKTVGDTSKVLIINRRSHMRFLLTSRSMTLDDPDML